MHTASLDPEAPIVPEKIRALTYALWVPGNAWPALLGLSQQAHHPALTPALGDLLARPCEARVALKAVQLLARASDPSARAHVYAAASHPAGPVRLEAIRALARVAPEDHALWARCIAHDVSPVIRRTACRVTTDPRGLRPALGDPVWRVRRDAAHRLLTLIEGEARVEALLTEWGPFEDRRTSHAVRYLRACLRGETEVPHPPSPPWESASWWADDPAVLAGNLRHMPKASLVPELDLLLPLVGLQDGYPLDDWMRAIRRVIARVLVAHGEPEHWRAALRWLADARVPYAAAWARRLLARRGEASDPTVRERLPDWLLSAPGGLSTAALSWAVAHGQGDPTPWLAHDAPEVRGAALQRAAQGGRVDLLARGLEDPDASVVASCVEALAREAAGVLSRLPEPRWSLALHLPAASASLPEVAWVSGARSAEVETRRRCAEGLAAWPSPLSGALMEALGELQRDPDHHVRALAMTVERARAVVSAPRREPSWRVLASAAALSGVPLSNLAPSMVQRISATSESAPSAQLQGPYFPMRLQPRQWRAPGQRPYVAEPGAHHRTLGGAPVTPLAISGRYGMPEEGYELALSRGVTTFFWEPEYTTLTRWIRSLPEPARHRLSLIGGTFASEPRDIARDLRRMREALGVPRVTAFILFWVRSTDRLVDEVAELLWTEQAEGRAATFGLSTHDRGLAMEAMHRGWPTVMLRLSAGHPGAEVEALPLAERLGVEIITFSNLCYGQMLRSRGGRPLPFTPADCYRYALSQPAVKVSLSAPRTLKQLNQNLDVLAEPSLSAARQAQMRDYTRPIRGETRRLIRLLRNV